MDAADSEPSLASARRAHDAVDAPGQDEKQTYEKQTYERKRLSANHSTSPPTWARRKPEAREPGLCATVCDWALRHQLCEASSTDAQTLTLTGLSANLLILLGLTHILMPRARTHTRRFLELSYRDEASGKYGTGPDDVNLVALGIVVLTGLRAGCLDHGFVPLGRLLGMRKASMQVRFAEQAWLCTYYTASTIFGMVSGGARTRRRG
jgi:hypothetical protein